MFRVSPDKLWARLSLSNCWIDRTARSWPSYRNRSSPEERIVFASDWTTITIQALRLFILRLPCSSFGASSTLPLRMSMINLSGRLSFAQISLICIWNWLLSRPPSTVSSYRFSSLESSSVQVYLNFPIREDHKSAAAASDSVSYHLVAYRYIV